MVSALTSPTLARLPSPPDACETAGGRSVSSVCPFLTIAIVTDGLAAAATRAR